MKANTKKRNIMIVDDTPDNLGLLENILHTNGYDVSTFPSGVMALRAAIQSPPDLVLLDIMMPDMDGYQVCQNMKSDPNLREIPIVFISALDDTDSKIRAFREGGVDYITKPFQEEEVLARVGTHLDLRNQKQEIKKLLNETLIGALKALSELLAISDPQAYRKTLVVSQYMRVFCHKAKLKNGWMFNVAANLLNLGNLAVEAGPRDFDEKIEKDVSQTGGATDETFSEIAGIIRRIPRLEIVAGMVENTTHYPQTKSHWQFWAPEVLGGQLLRIASGMEHRLRQGFSESEALANMAFYGNNPRLYHTDLVRDFGVIVFDYDVTTKKTTKTLAEKFKVMLEELEVGQVLEEDLKDKTGKLLLSRGTFLTKNLLVQIEKRNSSSPLAFPVLVSVDSEKYRDAMDNEHGI